MSRVYLQTLDKTCAGCPAQWEGTTVGGADFYARFRNGCWSVRVADEYVASGERKGSLDGFCEIEDIVAWCAEEGVDLVLPGAEPARAPPRVITAARLMRIREAGMTPAAPGDKVVYDPPSLGAAVVRWLRASEALEEADDDMERIAREAGWKPEELTDPEEG